MELIVTGSFTELLRIPARYENDPLVAGRVFYTIPRPLLEELVASCGRAAFKPALLEMERALAEPLASNGRLVGYGANGEAFTYMLLDRDAASMPKPWDEMLARMGKTREQYEQFRLEAERRSTFYLQAMRGYAGWLMTEPKFLQERDGLLERWKDQIADHGLPQSGPTFFGDVPHREFFRQIRGGDTLEYLNAFATFYARWRLQHLVTPELPEPLAPQVPILTPLALLTHMQTGGVTLYQPDTMPVPPRDDLRRILEDVRINRKNEHLGEWIDMVKSSRHSDHALRSYGQIFLLHHYWSLLEGRHAGLFDGRVEQIQTAFAKFLNVSPDTVDKYRQRIRNRLTPASPPHP